MHSHFPYQTFASSNLPTTRRFLPQVFVAVLALYGFFTLLGLFANKDPGEPKFDHYDQSEGYTGKRRYGPGNNTIGFERIFALSPRDIDQESAWRPEGMLKAAERTGLSIEIIQPEPPLPWMLEAMIDRNALKSIRDWGTETSLTKAAGAKAWLGHLDVLKKATQHTTTLLLEDDADWDVEIKKQMPLYADAVRRLTNYSTSVNDTMYLPYGDRWDVLWLGHCGNSVWDEWGWELYDDPTVPTVISSWDEKVQATAKTQQRYAYHSDGPICSWAYAVTSEAATKILEMPTHGQVVAFDLWLGERCRDKSLNCIAAGPELFRTHTPPGQVYSMIDGFKEDVAPKAETLNILHSARCNLNTTSENLVSCLQEPDTADTP